MAVFGARFGVQGVGCVFDGSRTSGICYFRFSAAAFGSLRV